jgi:branched-chain amino acid aminotransferase
MTRESLFVNVNGQMLAAEAPAIGALDRGLLYGDGLFETLRAYNGVPFLLDEHLRRLREAANDLRISDGLDTAMLRRHLADLLRLNGPADAQPRDSYVRITLTRGAHAGGLELEPAASPTLCIIVRPLHGLAPSLYERGIAAITASIRQNAESPLPRYKTLNYLANLLAKTEARERGADEAILLNTRGEVAEAASSNVFLVLEGRLVTPSLDANILPGVTRREVLRLAEADGLPAEERTVWPDDLRRAEEAFLTNSIAELLPVRAIDGHRVGAGAPGPVTRRLHSVYRSRVEHLRNSTTLS